MPRTTESAKKILAIIVFSGLALIYVLLKPPTGRPDETQNTLSDSFTMKLYSDDTSSGAGRRYDATLTFEDGRMVSGWQSYQVWPGSYPYTYRFEECTFDASVSSWVGNGTTGEFPSCDASVSDRGILQARIDSGKLVPSDGICHYVVCYEIV
jgi:hypothetical protein